MKISDLFAPRWKHSNPDVRAEAIAEIPPRDLQTLETIATTDPSAELRIAAVAKIRDARALERVAGANGQPHQVLDALHRSLDRIFKDVVLSARDLEQATPSLTRIAADSVLADIAIETDQPDIRVGAIQRINTLDELCRVAEHNCGREAGAAIIARIDDTAALERLADTGSNKVVRREAREKLDALAPAPVKTQERVAAKREQELTQLAADSQEWAETYNFAFFQEKFAKGEDRWRQLDPKLQHADRETFQRNRTKFDERLNAFTAKRQAEIRAAEERVAITSKREALCERLDYILQPSDPDANLDPDMLERSLAGIRAEWEALPAMHSDIDAEIAERFAAQGRHIETIIKREREDRGTLDRLTAIVEQVEGWAANEDDGNLPNAKTLDKVLQEAAAMDFAATEVEPLTARLQAAAASIRQRREARDAAAREAELAPRQDLLARVQALLDAVESKDATDAIKAAQAELKALPKAKSTEARDLDSQIRDAANAFFDKRREHHAEKDIERWANLTAKELLCDEAEAFDARNDFPELANAIKEIQQRWKAIGHVPREKSDEIWNRFHGACDRNYERCKAFFAKQNEERDANAVIKRDLIETVQSLMNSTDWGPAGEEIKAAQAKWKETGPAPRKDEQQLWEQFQESCNTFFERRNAHFEKLDEKRPANTEAKERLVEEAQAIANEPDWRDADQLRRLQDEWKSVGYAEKEKEEELWQAFKAAGDTFYAYLDEQRPAFLEQKKALLAELNTLLEQAEDPTHDQVLARQIMDLQKQWREIGPGPRDEEKAVWDEFHAKCDTFFTERKQVLAEIAEEREGNAASKREICEQAEALAESTEWRETADKLKQLQRDWQAAGPAPHKEEKELWERFRAACDKFFTARRNQWGERQDRREENLQAKEELVARLEGLLGIAQEADEPAAEPEAEADAAEDAVTPEDLAKQLTIALQANFVAGDAGSSGGSIHQDVRDIQSRWKDIGPVPREHDRALWSRYRAALDHYYQNQGKR